MKRSDIPGNSYRTVCACFQLSFDNFYFQFDPEPCDKEMQSAPQNFFRNLESRPCRVLPIIDIYKRQSVSLQSVIVH